MPTPKRRDTSSSHDDVLRSVRRIPRLTRAASPSPLVDTSKGRTRNRLKLSGSRQTVICAKCCRRSRREAKNVGSVE